MPPKLYLVRHGETEWTVSRRHTGRTDIPLTDRGREEAAGLCAPFQQIPFALVLSSPSSRALDTCRLAGMGDGAVITDDLLEWDYGEYNGRTTAEIRKRQPRWSLWLDGCPGGETATDVGRRADRVIADVRRREGNAVLFSHGHMLRTLTARWLGLSPTEGRLFMLHPATISTLGYERKTPVILRWNDPDVTAPART